MVGVVWLLRNCKLTRGLFVLVPAFFLARQIFVLFLIYSDADVFVP